MFYFFSNRRKLVGLFVCLALLLGCMWTSLISGATYFSWQTAWNALFQYDPGVTDQMVIRTTRLPRALIAAAVGASLAMAGCLMQALTRNPLASPSVLGINASATFFVVFAVLALTVQSMQSLMWISFAGAAVGAALAYVLSSLGRDSLSPVRIVLAGSAITALFASATQTLLVLNRQGLNTVLFWLTGSIAGRSAELLQTVLPYMAVCWLVAMLLAKEMNVLAMGEQIAKGLGQRTLAIKAVTVVIIIVLAGGAVSVAGPIGLVGIMVPAITRFFVGNDHRWTLPYCALLGGSILTAADVAARFLISPEEFPVGVVMAVIGAPFFIYIARKGARQT
jgi:iron complex transport system permease protein